MSTMSLQAANNQKTFTYGVARVKDFAVHATTSVNAKSKAPKRTVSTVEVDGLECRASKRFWTSIQCRFGFSANMFRYFDHKEVFDRVSVTSPNDRVRYCVEKDNVTGKRTLLAVTNPVANVVRYDALDNLLKKYEINEATYSNGIVRSTHKPRIGNAAFKLAGDEFANQFIIDTPIDGFGKPNIYLSLLRMICSNGAVGFTKAFRSEIVIGKKDDDVTFALIRAMDGFNNEDGYAALRQRFESAAGSWASINEVQRLYRVLINLASAGHLKKTGKEYVDGKMVETALPIFEAYHKMTGDITRVYGLANLDALSQKRQRTLPAGCKMYDLLNFATEVATHQAKPEGARKLQAFVGDVISSEYDLEGTCDKFNDWRDFFVGHEATADTMRFVHSRN